MTALRDLANGPALDAAVIGGGINGCAIARELADRGLRVALFEKDDFGFGTTWRSTKLIHGGLRYLEHGDVRLVFESLRERAWLLRTRPHLVKRQRFVLPLVPWTRRPAWQLRIGLSVYDLLALRGGLPGHRRLDGVATRRLAPAIVTTSGSLGFYDGLAVAPERLALELALEARERGAFVFNHASVTRIETRAGAVAAVAVACGEGEVRIPAGAVINAAGPWVDAVNRLDGDAGGPLLGVTRGTHIALQVERSATSVAIISTAKSDGRVFFVIPREGMLLVGTTDDRFNEPPDAVRPTTGDVAYLLAEAETLLPSAGIGPEAVRYAYAGLRPLQRVPGGPEAAISRRHAVVAAAASGGPRGLYSVVGGKLSTFRPLAAEVAKLLDAPEARQREREQAFGGAGELPPSLAKYGPVAAMVRSLGADVVCPHAGLLQGEIVHAVRRELAVTLSDILLRRTGAAWGPSRGLCCAAAVADVAAEELGWNTGERERQIRQFERDVRMHLPALEEVEP